MRLPVALYGDQGTGSLHQRRAQMAGRKGQGPTQGHACGYYITLQLNLYKTHGPSSSVSPRLCSSKFRIGRVEAK